MYLISPPHIGNIKSFVKEVNIWEGDSIEWLWHHHYGGSYVYGYVISRKP